MLNKMIHKLFICPLLLISSIAMGEQALPDEFTVTERWLSWTTTFDIETKEQVLGTVHRKLFSLVPEYHLMDTQENLLAKARMRFFSFLTVFDVEDHNENLIGTVNQEFTFLFPTFKILAPNGRILGQAVLNFWGTTYTISDPLDGHTIAILSRPFLRLKSNWTVTILDQIAISENNIHPHLFLTLLAFQVDKEYWAAERRRNQQQNNNNNYASFATKGSLERAGQGEEDLLNNEVEMLNGFRKQLEAFRHDLVNIHPSAEDFKVIESITFNVDVAAEQHETVDQVQENFQYLFSLFNSSELTQPQKAALYLMLDNLLEQHLDESILEEQ